MDISIYMGKIQEVPLNDYYANLREYITEMGREKPALHQVTTRKTMPKTMNDFVDKVVIFHPHPDVGNSLPAMSPAWEM